MKSTSSGAQTRGRFPRPRSGALVGKTMTIGGETLARRRGSGGGSAAPTAVMVGSGNGARSVGAAEWRHGGGAVNGGEQLRGDALSDRLILDERRDFDELDDVVDSNEVGRPWLILLLVRKEKLGDRITALQQLVSPFGKPQIVLGTRVNNDANFSSVCLLEVEGLKGGDRRIGGKDF
ncbi:hypothetical protein Scep_009392 [Stephania cephalantha]|uniref:Uncharacterized protein n=1 Tax=Stephania cephalantha TaxID=152367 RepID=A0AAP0JTM7_9MAGN